VQTLVKEAVCAYWHKQHIVFSGVASPEIWGRQYVWF